MSDRQNGPPIEDGAPKGPTDVEALPDPTINTAHDSRSDRQAAHDAHWCRGDQPRQVEHVSDQLRRRRAAAWRLPPLSHGRRDPWSRVRG
jgi:hypothetical protein